MAANVGAPQQSDSRYVPDFMACQFVISRMTRGARPHLRQVSPMTCFSGLFGDKILHAVFISHRIGPLEVVYWTLTVSEGSRFP